MSQVEKTRGKLERATGKNRLRCRGSFVMKRSGFVSYNRRCKEEWPQLDTEVGYWKGVLISCNFFNISNLYKTSYLHVAVKYKMDYQQL